MVLQFLADLFKIDLVLHPNEVELPAVTVEVENMKLSDFLDLLAKRTGTRWGIRDEAVYFTPVK